MRFTKIEGTTVAVHVTSAEEAKAALKELRHKKKELKFLRGALAKQHKASPKRGKAKPAPKSGLETFFDDMRWGISSMLQPSPNPRRRNRASRRPPRSSRSCAISTRSCTTSKAASCSCKAS